MLIDIDEKTTLAICAATSCMLKSQLFERDFTYVLDYHSKNPKSIRYSEAKEKLRDLLDILLYNILDKKGS